jgi:molybdenum cofactor cytidylyltransferase
MKLIRALRYYKPASVAFVGAGGKTTAIFRAARELLTTNIDVAPIRTVLVTTTTHFGAWQAILADHVWKITAPQDIQKLEKAMPSGVGLLYGDEINDRLVGLQPKLIEGVHQLSEQHSLPLLIEADGAHTRPLKAPAEHEPAIPDFVKVVVVLAGLSGLDKPLTNEWVHHPDKFSELTGLQLGEIITSDAMVMMLLNKKGGLRNVPQQAHRIAILNQADTPELQSRAKTIGEKLLPEYEGCIIASLSSEERRNPDYAAHTFGEMAGIHAVIERTGGVVLAAGSSSRFGEPKQLLKWKDEPLIRHVARSALQAGLSPVVVVVGSSAMEVQGVLKDLPLRIVNNSGWMEGMSTSVKAGLEGLKGEVGGVVFLQADQPQIPASLIKSLVEAHQARLNPIIAPQIDGQRGNPVLFDRDTFPDLLAIEADMGGRALFSRFPVEWVTWHDSKLLIDIDSPEDYQTFLHMYPESEAKG